MLYHDPIIHWNSSSNSTAIVFKTPVALMSHIQNQINFIVQGGIPQHYKAYTMRNCDSQFKNTWIIKNETKSLHTASPVARFVSWLRNSLIRNFSQLLNKELTGNFALKSSCFQCQSPTSCALAFGRIFTLFLDLKLAAMFLRMHGEPNMLWLNRQLVCCILPRSTAMWRINSKSSRIAPMRHSNPGIIRQMIGNQSSGKWCASAETTSHAWIRIHGHCIIHTLVVQGFSYVPYM